ncbi:hypothetical protein J4E81_005606 [Alternaria sp. BMP 2799]|nr:hypothetical protein J4E81_005606 [Alternaria sp. BMP 2799]
MEPFLLNVEMLEWTLSMLPVEDLLRYERVSKRWCELIRDNQNTSKTLFRYRQSMAEQIDSSPRDAFLEKRWLDHGNSRSTGSEVLADCIAHPLLSRFFESPKASSIAAFNDPKLPYISCWHLLRTLNRRNGLPNPDASWRRMFVTWPPLKEIELHVSYRLHDDQPNKEKPKVIKISEPEGITLNHFFYALSGSAILKWGRTASSIMEWNKAITESWFTKKYRGMRIRVVPIIRVKENERKTAAKEA